MYSFVHYRILADTISSSEDRGNDDNTPIDDDTDDYDTGVRWWGFSLMVVGAAAFAGLIAYAVVIIGTPHSSPLPISLYHHHDVTAPLFYPISPSNEYAIFSLSFFSSFFFSVFYIAQYM